MKSIEINGALRTNLGKTDSKNLRKEENVPCVLYTKDENIHFYATEKEFKNLVYTPHVYTAKLNINGTQYNAIMQDIQFHPVTDKILHIDFLKVSEDNKIVMEIPVELEGFAPGVQAGGKLQLVQRKLKVRAFLKDLPDKLKINISDLQLGKAVKVGELDFENVELLGAKNAVVCAVKLTRAARGAARAAAEAAASAGKGKK